MNFWIQSESAMTGKQIFSLKMPISHTSYALAAINIIAMMLNFLTTEGASKTRSAVA